MRTTNRQTSVSKTILNARLSRLTETARLLKNVKSVFTRRSNAASRVNTDVELSRKLFYLTTACNQEKQKQKKNKGSQNDGPFVQILCLLSSPFVVFSLLVTNKYIYLSAHALLFTTFAYLI